MLINLALAAAAWLLLIAATRLTLTKPHNPLLEFRIRPGSRPRPWWVTAAVAGGAVIVIATVLLSGLNHALATAGSHGASGARMLSWIFAVLVLAGCMPVIDRYVQGRPCKVAAAASCTIIVGVWLAYPGWMTTDLVAALFLIQLLTTWQFRASFAVVAGVLLLTGGYDAVQVFLTHGMTQEAGAMLGKLPMLIVVPARPDLAAPAAAALGIGDIWLPGLLAVMAGRVSQRTGDPGYYRAAAGGYAAGLVAAIIVLHWVPVLPATIFLVPGITAVVTVAAARRGALAELTASTATLPAA